MVTVPIGTTEYGANGLGHYLKYPNGVLMCWRYVTLIPQLISSGGWGGIDIYQYVGLTFPHAFVDEPYVNISNIGGGTYTLGQIQRSATEIIKIELFRPFSDSARSEFYIFAIGRWK